MSKVFDFLPEFRDFNKMLAEECAWQVVNGDVYNIDNMTDEELRSSIVDDVLAVTMWEQQTDQQVVFTLDTLCRSLTPEQRIRVEQLVSQPETTTYLDYTHGVSIRIKDERAVQQAAMDYVGVWYDGFDMPEGVMTIDREAFQSALDEHGGIDNFANAIAMELSSTHDVSKTLN